MLLIGLVLIITTLNQHNSYAEKLDRDWIAVQEWARSNSDKHDKFLITQGAGNFRTRSLRSSIAEVDSALAWVDPDTLVINSHQSELVNRAFDGNVWDIEQLIYLGNQWNGQYIVVMGPYTPQNIHASFESGPYTVIKVP